MTPDPGLPDATLASRAAKGDQRAFARLVSRYQEPLYRLLRRYTGDADEAYEAAHEAFIAAWSALPRYDPGRSFGAWLRTIAINKARDRGRRLAFRRMLFGSKAIEDDAEALALSEGSPAPDDVVVDRERMAALDRAVAGLPARLKAALILTAFEGLPHQEAAAILGVSAKTVETRTYRARKLLSDTLDPALRPPR